VTRRFPIGKLNLVCLDPNPGTVIPSADVQSRARYPHQDRAGAIVVAPLVGLEFEYRTGHGYRRRRAVTRPHRVACPLGTLMAARYPLHCGQRIDEPQPGHQRVTTPRARQPAVAPTSEQVSAAPSVVSSPMGNTSAWLAKCQGMECVKPLTVPVWALDHKA
jgi:hypothetical protein